MGVKKRAARAAIIALFAMSLIASLTLQISAVSAQGKAIKVNVTEVTSGSDSTSLRVDVTTLTNDIGEIEVKAKLPSGFEFTDSSDGRVTISETEIYNTYSAQIALSTADDTLGGSDTGSDTPADTSSADTAQDVRHETAAKTSDSSVILAVAALTVAVAIAMAVCKSKRGARIAAMLAISALILPIALFAPATDASAEAWSSNGCEIITLKQDFTMNDKTYQAEITVTSRSERSYESYKEIFVDAASGSDTASGGIDAPLRTLDCGIERAKELLSESSASCNVTVYLRRGEYFTSGITVSGDDYLNKSSNLTISSYNGEEVVVSSNTYIPASGFTAVDGKPYYKYIFDSVNGEYPRFEDLYVNGKSATIAASEKSDFILGSVAEIPTQSDESTYENGLYLSKSALSEILAAYPEGGDLSPMRCTIRIEWNHATVRVKNIDVNDKKVENRTEYLRVIFNDEDWQALAENYNMQASLSLKDREFSFSNSLAFLDREGEYFYDRANGTLYYYPIDGTDIQSSAFAYPSSENLIKFESVPGATVYGITFTGTTSNYITDHYYIAGQANMVFFENGDVTSETNTPLRHAAILSENGSNVRIDSCTFRELGTNGVMVSDKNENTTVINSSFEDIAMSAISVGTPRLYWMDEGSSKNVLIANNYIGGTGTKYYTACGVYIARVDTVKVLHNTIKNSSYSALSIGWHWSSTDIDATNGPINIKNAEIAYNNIQRYMTELKDGGAIYVVGGNDSTSNTDIFNYIHHNYIDRSGGAYGDRGIYLDGASSNWRVHNNVVANAGTPVFAQYHVESQYTHNNLIDQNYTTIKINDRNASDERNVIVRDNYDSYSLDLLKEEYPETNDIISTAGVIG